jgi:glutamate/tyrosine decarboxylase-like PLP-dependent enzyme
MNIEQNILQFSKESALGDASLESSLRQIYQSRTRQISAGPISPFVTPGEIRAYLTHRFNFDDPIPLDELVEDVEGLLQNWQVQVTHPRYFGLFNPSVTLASVVADTLVAIYNPQVASWSTSPAANEIERHTLNWMAAQFGYGPETTAHFTTGGSEANLSAVIVALTKAFPEYGEHGLQTLTAGPTIYLTDEAHHSFSKIAHITGIGRKALRKVAVGANLKMDVDALVRQLEEDRQNGYKPFLVVGTAGTTSAGVIDPLQSVAELCRSHGLWFHVDAAWGGAAMLSPTLRRHFSGIELADSVTCDAHKWLSVPMGCGMFFCRHREAVEQAFRVDAAYMPAPGAEAVRDPYRTSIQWSRRFIGLKLFLTLAHHGHERQAAILEQQTELGNTLRELLTASGWRIVNDTPLPLICFTREGLNVPRFLEAMRREQVAWMSETRIEGAAVIRACVTSFKTTPDDIYDVVQKMNRLIS